MSLIIEIVDDISIEKNIGGRPKDPIWDNFIQTQVKENGKSCTHVSCKHCPYSKVFIGAARSDKIKDHMKQCSKFKVQPSAAIFVIPKMTQSQKEEYIRNYSFYVYQEGIPFTKAESSYFKKSQVRKLHKLYF
jgi:hypothetical protein